MRKLGHGTCVLRDSVCVGEVGACIVAEQGAETGVWQGNLVIGTGGGSMGDAHGRGSINDFGHSGFGYWMRGPMVRIGGDTPDDGNVAAGVFGSAFSYDIPFTNSADILQPINRALGELSNTDVYYAAVLANARARVGIDAADDPDNMVELNIRGITNHLFRNNVATGTPLVGPLFELWYSTAPPYRIESSEFELRSRRGAGVRQNTAVMAFYTALHLIDSTVRGYGPPGLVDGRTTGVEGNGTNDVRLLVTGSRIEGFNVGVGTSIHGVEVTSSTLRNEACRTNAELQQVLGASFGGIALPCDPGDRGSCSYGSGARLEYGTSYGVEGYVTTENPAPTVVRWDRYNRVWGGAINFPYVVCRDIDGNGLLTCDSQQRAAGPISSCQYLDADGNEDGELLSCATYEGSGDDPAAPTLAQLPDRGVYSSVVSVEVTPGETRPQLFLYARMNGSGPDLAPAPLPDAECPAP